MLKKIAYILLAICMTLAALAGCAEEPVPSETPSATPVAEPSVEPEPSEFPMPDLTLNVQGSLDGMTYMYNVSWPDYSNPLTKDKEHTYAVQTSPTERVLLTFLVSDADEETLRALPEMDDEERTEVFNPLIEASMGQLVNGTFTAAQSLPEGVHAMWAFSGDSPYYQPPLVVHGFDIIGDGRLYRVAVSATNDKAYADFEPTWSEILNSMVFTPTQQAGGGEDEQGEDGENAEGDEEAEPTETPSASPTPSPTPEPQGFYGRWVSRDGKCSMEVEEGDDSEYDIFMDVRGADPASFDQWYMYGDEADGVILWNGTVRHETANAPADGTPSEPVRGTLELLSAGELRLTVDLGDEFDIIEFTRAPAQ